MSKTLFVEDFDGNGAGFSGPVFGAWSIGGVPVDAGHWKQFFPDAGPEAQPNLTPGSGKYAGVHSHSFEFTDTLVWLISPLIDTEEYRKLVLSADVHFKSNGIAAGEDRVEVLVLPVGSGPQKIGVIGETMSSADPPISDRLSWDINLAAAGWIQIAFTWQSSIGPADFDSIQLDNINLEGFKLSPGK